MTAPSTPAEHDAGTINARRPQSPVAGRVEGMSFRPDARFWVFYGCLMTVQFLSAMYQTAVTTALPTVIGELGGVAHMSWAITAYTLGQTLAMPVTGKLGDLVGRKCLYLVAIALFIGGSVLCGIATGMVEFIVFRFLQGTGGGGLMIASQGITGDLIPPRVRGKYMAPMGAMFGIAAIVGPLLGGWLTDTLGWRSIFWFFLPFGVIAWVAVALALQMPRRRGRVSVDWAGLALSSAGAAGIVLIATWVGSTLAWSDPRLIALIVVTVLAWCALIPVERRAAEALMPLPILTDRTFIVSTIVAVLLCACMFGINGYLPTYLQMVHGVSAATSGLVLVPGAVAMFLGSLISGWLVTRTGRYRIYPVLGSLLTAVGLIVLGLIPASANVWWFGVGVFVLELGVGMFLQLSVLIIQNALPARVLGTATSTNNFSREIGGRRELARRGPLHLAAHRLPHVAGHEPRRHVVDLPADGRPPRPDRRGSRRRCLPARPGPRARRSGSARCRRRPRRSVVQGPPAVNLHRPRAAGRGDRLRRRACGRARAHR